MTMFPDMTKLMNPSWARWFDQINQKTGGLNLAQARRPSVRAMMPQQEGPSTDELVAGSQASRNRSRQVSLDVFRGR